MKRRDFIQLSLAVGLSPWFGEMAFAQAGGPVRVRKSAASPAAARDIETLRKGVGLLKANSPATRYDSWMYWANSHGTTSPVPPAMNNVWNQCQHGTEHFLPWHRAYIFFLESLLRETTQTDGFALPYWDWFGSNAIPEAYAKSTTATGAANTLYHANRRYRRRTLVQDALSRPTFMPFQSSLEGNPHGTVHVMVGGDMGSVPTSAGDPLFWAHHVNVDRMWEVWLNADSSRRNPTNTAWLNEEFAYDVDGQKKKKTSEVLDTESQLGYKYDSVAPATSRLTAPPRPAAAIAVPIAAN